MSAVNVVIGGDRVTVYTDGASVDEAGVLRAIMTKTVPVPHLDGVFASTGHPVAGIMMAGLIADAGCTSFDEAEDCLANNLRIIAKHPSYRHSQVIFAGWSRQRDMPRAWLVQSHESPDVAAYTKTRVHGLTLPAPLDLSLAGSVDPVKTMESQRASDKRSDGNPSAHVVGGFIQETVITRVGISSRILKRWNDEIGKRIVVASDGGGQ